MTCVFDDSTTKLIGASLFVLALAWAADAGAQPSPSLEPEPMPPSVNDDVPPDAPPSPRAAPGDDLRESPEYDSDVPQIPAPPPPPEAEEPESQVEPEAENEREPHGVRPAVQVPYKQVVPPPPQPTEAELVSHRKLGDHYFPPAVFVPPALTYSYFGVRAGIEYHSVPGYSRDLSFFGDGNFRPTTLKTINAAETVDLALRLHDYVAIVGGAYGLARVGANTPTLLGTGADYTYGGDAGLLVKLFRIAGFQAAVRAQIGGYAGQQAGIIELFQDIGGIVSNEINELVQIRDITQINLPMRLREIENAIGVATRAMLTPFRGVQYGGSLNLAQGLGSAFGLQIALGIYGRSTTYDIPVFEATTAQTTVMVRSSDRFWQRAGVALDVNLERILMPIDLIAEYELTNMSLKSDLPAEVADRSWIEHLFAFGIYYAELLDLQLGLTGYILYGQDPLAGANAQAAGKPLDVGGQFVFRFMR